MIGASVLSDEIQPPLTHSNVMDVLLVAKKLQFEALARRKHFPFAFRSCHVHLFCRVR